MSLTDIGGNNEQATAAPTLNVLAQYVKDLSFENPRAPQSLQARQSPPPINISVNVEARPIGQSEVEVTLTLEARAGTESDVLFNVEIAFAGVFRIGGVPEEHMHAFVMIECPRLLFPFARQIVADAVRDGGFPPLMIDPIDFVALFQQNLNRQNSRLS